ncbi:MAG: reverse transcriptase N-terminal domain-containing protein [Paludibacter sp.]|nr:reverse transcriptase N-terminal domain-containing protein [Paludibacter sp.]
MQYLLTHSFCAKSHAVKKVTSNKGKNTSGIDKKLWLTSASKMKALLTLSDKHYRAKPLRRAKAFLPT